MASRIVGLCILDILGCSRLPLGLELVGVEVVNARF